MTHWQAIQYAPQDGTTVRVLVHGPKGRRELPWLVYWNECCWCYRTTGAPLHSWHEPLEWSAEPRTPSEQGVFHAAIVAASGSPLLPSWGRHRPILHLVAAP